jgi:hypothetical protein
MWPLDALGYLILVILLVIAGAGTIKARAKKVSLLGIMFFALALRNILPMIVVTIRHYDADIYNSLANPLYATIWIAIGIAGTLPFLFSLYKNGNNSHANE